MSEQSDNHSVILKRLDDMEIAQGKRFKAIEDKLDPIYLAWTNVSGFEQISIWLFKVLIGLGAAIGALYVVVEFLKKVGKP